MAYHVFISYRREGGYEIARLLYDRLKHDGYEPFLDVEQMRSGKFNTQLYDCIAECEDFLLVLSPHALDRCKNEGDWVRAEIMEAIRLKKPITPFMLRNFAFPRRKAGFFSKPIPQEILDLSMNEGVAASQEYFDASYDKLKRLLTYKPLFSMETSLSAQKIPTSEDERKQEILQIKREVSQKFAARLAAAKWHMAGVKQNNTVCTVGDKSNNCCNTSSWQDVVAVACGDDFTVGLQRGGTVLSTDHRADHLKNIVAIDCCGPDMIALRKNGTVIAPESYSSCASWKNIIDISAGDSHVLALKKDGTVVADGKNDHGQCLTSDWTDIVAIAAGDGFSVGLKKDGSCVATGSNRHYQCEVSSWNDIISISAGKDHAVGLKMDGTVVAAGLNDLGQCDVSYMKNIIAIKADEELTFGITEEGRVVSSNYTKRFSWYNLVAISAGPKFCLGLKRDGTVVSAGLSSDERKKIKSWKDISAISVGNGFAVAMKSDGTAVGIKVGETRNDQDSFQKIFGACNHWRDLVSVSAGKNHIIGLTKNGHVLFAGDDYNRQSKAASMRNVTAIEAGSISYGINKNGSVTFKGDLIHHGTKKRIRALKNVTALSARKTANDSGFAALKKDGTVEFILDADTKIPYDADLDLSNWNNVTSIAVGRSHVLGLKRDGTVISAAKQGTKLACCNVADWEDMTAVAAGDSYSLGLRNDGCVVVAGNPDIRDDVMGWNLLK